MIANDHNTTVEYPFPKDEVFKAVLTSELYLDKIEIDSYDELTGRVAMKAGVSMRSWGEKIFVLVREIDEKKTAVSISSEAKTGAIGSLYDLGKNRDNIENIFDAVSAILQGKHPGEDEEEYEEDPYYDFDDEGLTEKKIFLYGGLGLLLLFIVYFMYRLS